MVELSDADKKAILGANYKSKSQERDLAIGATDASRLAKENADKAQTISTTAFGVAVVALLILVTNFYSVASPYNPGLAIGCALTVAAAAGIAFIAARYRKSLAI